MLRGKSPSARALALAALGLASACIGVPATALAVTAPSRSDLSPRLAELAKPAVGSASPAKQAKALSLAVEGAGSLLRDGNRVVVEVRFDEGAAASVDDLRDAGAKIVNVSRRYRTVTVAARPSQLKALTAVPRVAGATEVLTPFTSESTCPAGAVVSEGDLKLRAAEARSTFAADGTGVTVGILSDSFDQASEAADESGPIATHKAEDVAAGDLPGFANTCAGEETPVEILDDAEGEGNDEGRAMAQVVHDLAPGARLAFATAFAGEVAFAENIERLAKPPSEGGDGAKVIVDDVTYPGEPFFQEGPIAVAVDKAAESGITYFSAAGNNSTLAGGNQIGSWEAEKFRDSGGCPAAVHTIAAFKGNACMDFNPGPETDRTLGIEVAPGGTLKVDLQWSEPWFGVETNLDAYLLDSGGNLIAGSNANNPGGSKVPLEFFEWKNSSSAPRIVQLVVNRFSGSGTPRLKAQFPENGSEAVTALEYPRSSGTVGEPATDTVGPTAFGHSTAAGAITVGAVPFSKVSAVEKYSSRGPLTYYFGPEVNFTPVEGELPGEQLEPPLTLSKPELAATDCGQTTFFAFEPLKEPVWRFCGTSAAAPHAAAVAALMLSKEPGATPATIRSALLSSAVPVGEADECAVGAGLVDAVGAIEDLLEVSPPTPPELKCKAPLAEVPVSEARAGGNWGSESPPTPPTPSTPPSTQSTPEQPPPPETDHTAPATFFHRHPGKLVRTRARTAIGLFELGSSEAGSSFVCQVDGGPTRSCPAQFSRRYRPGPHVVRVWARDAAGNTDSSAAVFRFRVARIR